MLRFCTELGLAGKDLNLLATRMYMFSHKKSIWPVSWRFGLFKFAITGPTYFETAGGGGRGANHLHLWPVEEVEEQIIYICGEDVKEDLLFDNNESLDPKY